MKKLFRRHKKDKEPASSSTPSASTPIRGPSTVPEATPPGVHVCTPLCDGISSLPPEYHESVIASLQTQLGADQQITNLRVSNMSLNFSNMRLVGESREAGTVESRRDIEGNTSLSRIPLALTSTFEYAPLPKGYARFLKPIGQAAHPMALLESHSLENPPSYIAISYCWDPTSQKRGMFLSNKGSGADNKSFAISETVLEVLNQVNAGYGSQLVWIDQICINQEDQDEKLDQIFRMGEIYSKAAKVFIWLGPTANKSDVALENMERMVNAVVRLNDATALRQELHPNIAAELNTTLGQLYGHLFSRPWFRRLWTVQEALLARELVVMCGYREVDFELLHELAYQILLYGSMDIIELPGVESRSMNEAIVGIMSLHALRPRNASVSELMEGFGYHRFRLLIAEARSRLVTMDADRVHALMGVAPLSIRQAMDGAQKRQRGQSVAQLYAYFAVCMLEQDPDWLFLSQAPSEKRLDGLPSWVPSLNSPQQYASRLEGRGFLAGISESSRHLINRRITPTELRANGFRVATVTEIVPQTAFTEDRQNMKHNDISDAITDKWHDEALRLCQKTYGHGPGQFPAFQVTILLAASREKPAMDGNGLAGYQMFQQACKMRAETRRVVEAGEVAVPASWTSLPNGRNLFIEHALALWRQGLSVDQYQLLITFSTDMALACAGRPYFATDEQLVGLGCPGMRVGDIVVVLYGCSMPYILRPRWNGTMEFVGDCYVHGLMNGEELARVQRNADETFKLI
jgi:hypothetical protein